MLTLKNHLISAVFKLILRNWQSAEFNLKLYHQINSNFQWQNSTEVSSLCEETKQQPTVAHYDVVILGGGLAGLTLARQLKQNRPQTTILVVEKRQHPVPETAFKVGESTSELATHYLDHTLDLKAYLEATQLSKCGMRFFFSQGNNVDITQRSELGEKETLPPLSGYQIDRGQFENRLRVEAEQQGVVMWDNCKVQQVCLDQSHHGVIVQRQGESVKVSAKWVVDASGRAGILKRQLKLEEKIPHKANAVWFRLDEVIDSHDWSEDAGWKARVAPGLRRLSTTHLMGPGYWVWLIPLSSGSTSIGIVTDAAMYPVNHLNRFERAINWLWENEPQLARIVEDKKDKLQDFHALRDYAYSCKQVFSAGRWCMTGEAGVFSDPLYSSGFDLIAMGNTFISDLIVRNLTGEAIDLRTELYNTLYLEIFQQYLTAYTGQYPIMGNTKVMMSKIVWDWAVYWSFIVLLFSNKKLCDLDFIASLIVEFGQLGAMQAYMQAFLRAWDKQSTCEEPAISVQLRDFDFLYQLHCNLSIQYNDEALRQQLIENLKLLQAIAVEMLDEANLPDFSSKALQRMVAPTPYQTTRRKDVARTLRKIWPKAAAVGLKDRIWG